MAKANDLESIKKDLYWAFNTAKKNAKACENYEDEPPYFAAMAKTAEAIIKVEEAIRIQNGRKPAVIKEIKQ